MSFSVKVLGSGTSTGVPMVGCKCKVCNSSDPRDSRQRASLFISKPYNILIDTSPDFRSQALQNNIQEISSVLYTHIHYDHVGGISDLRPFAFWTDKDIECYADHATYTSLKTNVPYLFLKNEHNLKHKRIPNLKFKPFSLNLSSQNPLPSFTIQGLKVQPIRLLHEPWSNLYSVGYIINNLFAYLTDFKKIYALDEQLLYGVDTIYVGAPLWKVHPSHQSIGEAIGLINRFKAKRGYIGHLSHVNTHEDFLRLFPEHISPAYDTLEFNC